MPLTRGYFRLSLKEQITILHTLCYIPADDVQLDPKSSKNTVGKMNTKW